MPGAAGFVLDPSFFLADQRTATLTPCDLGALLVLMSHAWNAGGSIPSREEDLAALSRLGPAWASSRLRDLLPAFFREESGRLVSVDLIGQLQHRRKVSAAKRRGGKASGKSRSRKDIEHMFNTRSTDVEHVFGGERGAGTSAPEALQTPRKPEQPPAVPILAPIRPPEPAPEPFRAAVPVAAFAGSCSPPHTPPIRDSQKSSLGYGGAGGKGCQEPGPIDVAQDAPELPLDLFGEPIRPTGRKRSRKPSKAQQEAATKVVDAYMEEVGSDYRRTKRADRNVALHIAEGVKVEDLLAAVRNYARHCDRLGTDPHYRKAPANFFGREDAFFQPYIKFDTEKQHGSKPTGNAGSGARVRTGQDYSAGIIKITLAAPETAPHGEPAPQGRPIDRPNPFADALGDRADDRRQERLAPIPLG